MKFVIQCAFVPKVNMASLKRLCTYNYRLMNVNQYNSIWYLSNRLFSMTITPQQIDPTATGLSFAERYAQRDSAGNVKLIVGDFTTYDKTFSSEDVTKFSKLTLNKNPLHDVNDNTAAQKQGFDGSIIHGMFSASIFSAAIGAHFPGAIAFDMNIRFRKPVYIDDSLNGIVTVKKVLGRKQLVKCSISGINQKKELCVTGSVTMLIRNLDTDDAKTKKTTKQNKI
eukprot:356808_1